MLYACVMQLKEFLAAERGRAARLALRLKRSQAFVSQISLGQRPIPPAAARVIEDESDGLVKRWESRPGDWFELWPELVGLEGAPAVPVGQSS